MIDLALMQYYKGILCNGDTESAYVTDCDIDHYYQIKLLSVVETLLCFSQLEPVVKMIPHCKFFCLSWALKILQRGVRLKNKMKQISQSRCCVGKVKEVRVRIRKMALSEKCVELLMANQAGSVRKGVCLNVEEDLMAKQAGIKLEGQKMEMQLGLNQSIDQVKFPDKDQMDSILGSRHRRRS